MVKSQQSSDPFPTDDAFVAGGDVGVIQASCSSESETTTFTYLDESTRVMTDALHNVTTFRKLKR
jgi:hypothetical protein